MKKRLRHSKRNSRRSQAQIIVTVLLILIVIAAVAILSNFVINLIRDNLADTGCFDTTGQLTFNGRYTFFNTTEKVVFVSITRGEASFNISGLVIGVEEGPVSKPYTIIDGKVPGGFEKEDIVMYKNRSGNVALELPDPQETLTYEINLAGVFENLNKLHVGGIVGKDKVCAFSDDIDVETVI